MADKEETTEETQETTETTETEETSTEETSEESTEETEQSEADESIEEVDSETLSLAKLLSNPATREATIKALSRDVKTEVDKGKTQDEAVKSVGAMLKQHFGKDWEFMADKLTPIFDYMFSYMAKLEGTITQAENARLDKDARVASNQFYKDHPEARKYESRIIELMSELDPKPGMDQVQYLEYLHLIASGGKTATSTALTNKVKARVDKNSTTAKIPGRTAAPTATQNQKMDLNAALAAAVKSTGFKG